MPKDVRDRGEGLMGPPSGRKVIEPVEGYKSLMELFMVMILRGQPGSKPDWYEGGHEYMHLLDVGKFINNKKKGVDV